MNSLQNHSLDFGVHFKTKRVEELTIKTVKPNKHNGKGHDSAEVASFRLVAHGMCPDVRVGAWCHRQRVEMHIRPTRLDFNGNPPGLDGYRSAPVGHKHVHIYAMSGFEGFRPRVFACFRLLEFGFNQKKYSRRAMLHEGGSCFI